MSRLTKKNRCSNSKTRKQNGGLGNWLSDKKPAEYIALYNDENGKDERKKLLKENYAFFTGVMALVVIKNKLDYPPFGPKTAFSQARQEEKLRVLFKAMSEWDELSLGEDMNKANRNESSFDVDFLQHTKNRAYPLGGHGIRQQAFLVAKASASSVGRAAVDAYNLGKSVTSKSSEAKPVVEQPVVEQPVVEKPVVEKPVVEQPAKQANWMPSFM